MEEGDEGGRKGSLLKVSVPLHNVYVQRTLVFRGVPFPVIA